MFARIWRRNGQTPSKRGVELPSTDTVKGGPAQRLSDLRRQLENAKEDERASLLETQRAALNTKTNYLLARVDETAEGRNGQEVFGYIDDAIRVSNAGIFVVGWLAHAKGAIRKMSVANSAGRQVEASYSPTPMSRADVTNEIRPTSFVMHDDGRDALGNLRHGHPKRPSSRLRPRSPRGRTYNYRRDRRWRDAYGHSPRGYYCGLRRR